MQVGKATASDVWRGLFVLSYTQLQICLVLPCSNPNSAYLHMQAADYPGSRYFIKERLKSRDHHMLKNQGKSSECSSQLLRSRTEAEPQQAPSPGGLSGSETAMPCKNMLAPQRESQGTECSTFSYINPSFSQTSDTKNLRTTFPLFFWGFFHLPTRHHLDTSEWSLQSKSQVFPRQHNQELSLLPLNSAQMQSNPCCHRGDHIHFLFIR